RRGGAGRQPVLQPNQPGGAAQQRNLTPEELAQHDAATRVSIRSARQGRCYASIDSLDNRPGITDQTKPPSVEEMWYAQMALWVEQDVIGALAAVNERAAGALPAGEQPWVGNMPVKHLIRFIMGNYVRPSSDAAATGGGSSSATGTISWGALPTANPN